MPIDCTWAHMGVLNRRPGKFGKPGEQLLPEAASSSSAVVPVVPAGSTGLDVSDIMRAVSGLDPSAFTEMKLLFDRHNMQRTVGPVLSTPITDLITQKRPLQELVLASPVSRWPNLDLIYATPHPPHNFPHTRDVSLDPELVRVHDVIKHSFAPLMSAFAAAYLKLSMKGRQSLGGDWPQGIPACLPAVR